MAEGIVSFTKTQNSTFPLSNSHMTVFFLLTVMTVFLVVNKNDRSVFLPIDDDNCLVFFLINDYYCAFLVILFGFPAH